MTEEFKNTYFKQGQGLISGFPLPLSATKTVNKIKFINCDFHPNCGGIQFIGCDFQGCSGIEYLILIDCNSRP